MSNYQMCPSPANGVGGEPFVTWNDGFSTDELDQLVSIGDSLLLSAATVAGSDGAAPPKVRISDVGWIGQEHTWLYDRLAFIARSLNGSFYNFDLWGMAEDMQYTVYFGDREAHYNWHQDFNASGTTPPRKLSLVLQLSDPADYEGGELEIFANGPLQVPKKRGLVAAFPSYMPHRVTPVTKGTRRSIVVWTCGERFR